MKVPYLLCLLTIISIKGHSQEYEYVAFPDLGAIWSEIYYHPEPTWPDTVHKPPSFERFAVSGEDTIINEFTYKKLYIFYDTVFVKNNATYVGGIREDEHKRIYFISDTVIHEHKPMNEFYNYEEIILYDFSLKVGDTIRNINCIPDDDRLVVKRIDTIQIGNTFRKRFSFDPVSWVQWIEGIGNLRGLLFTSGDLPFNGTYGDLICFKQNGKILYFNDNYP
ncbi:MAG: hypothetical protein U9N53_09505, partial [Bacteroidota bacterium]|nr:hypothetical protein [Bacteroidota bacterium]